jgi:hypothetical protein
MSNTKQSINPSATSDPSTTTMNNPAPSGILSGGDMDTMSAPKSVTYVLNDLSFLDKLSKKGRAEVLKNLRQISAAEKATADGTVKSLPRTTNLSYIVNDISFLDKLAKKGQAAVLKNIRQTPSSRLSK